MLVGNSLLDYLQGDTTDEGATSETFNTNSDEDDDDKKTLLGDSTLDRSSTSTSRTSNNSEDTAKSSDKIMPRRTDVRNSCTPPTSPLGNGIGPGSPNPVTAKSTHQITISGRASISNFQPSDSRKKRSQNIQGDLNEDDETLINALRPPANPASAEIIDAADFMQGQLMHNRKDEDKGESDGSTIEIREKSKAVSIDEEDSDIDGPPSDFDV